MPRVPAISTLLRGSRPSKSENQAQKPGNEAQKRAGQGSKPKSSLKNGISGRKVTSGRGLRSEDRPIQAPGTLSHLKAALGELDNGIWPLGEASGRLGRRRIYPSAWHPGSGLHDQPHPLRDASRRGADLRGALDWASEVHQERESCASLSHPQCVNRQRTPDPAPFRGIGGRHCPRK